MELVGGWVAWEKEYYYFVRTPPLFLDPFTAAYALLQKWLCLLVVMAKCKLL